MKQHEVASAWEPEVRGLGPASEPPGKRRMCTDGSAIELVASAAGLAVWDESASVAVVSCELRDVGAAVASAMQPATGAAVSAKRSAVRSSSVMGSAELAEGSMVASAVGFTTEDDRAEPGDIAGSMWHP